MAPQTAFLLHHRNNMVHGDLQLLREKGKSLRGGEVAISQKDGWRNVAITLIYSVPAPSPRPHKNEGRVSRKLIPDPGPRLIATWIVEPPSRRPKASQRLAL